MSLQAMTQVMDLAPAHWSQATQLVALVLADHVSADGLCFPSTASLARRTRLCRRQIQRIMAQLEKERVIIRSSRFDGSRQTSNLYEWTNVLRDGNPPCA